MEVAASDDGEHLARFRIESDERTFEAAGRVDLREPGANGLFGMTLEPHIERGVDSQAAFEHIVQRGAQELVLVSGYSGIGKSSVVNELHKVLVPDIKSYEAFLHETAFKLPGVTHVRSSVVLKEVKAETRLPLATPAAPKASARRASRN